MPVPPERPGPLEGRWYGFQDLVWHRVHNVLLVSSRYEAFLLSGEGQPHALLASEFLELGLRHVPRFRHVASGAEALELSRRQPSPDLVIATLHVSDMGAGALARRLRESGVDAPVVLLAFDAQALDGAGVAGTGELERPFVWSGDAALFFAIVKQVEDRKNAPHDVGAMGVQAILVVEDGVKHYSSFLPAMYAEVIAQARRLVPESLNAAHRLLRLQARPKILLSTTYEEAERDFAAYHENILGVVSDVEFPRGGRPCADAGVRFAERVRAVEPDVPIILHSGHPDHRRAAEALGAWFLPKAAPLMLHELGRFMTELFGFGDFVFRLPDGREVGRARDLRELEESLRTIPAESLAYHGERNHFSKWLKARTEFAVAQRLRPRRVSEFATVEELRAELIRSIQGYRQRRDRAAVADFDPARFAAGASFARLGGGSLGGKARGLAFVNLLLAESGVDARYPGVRVGVPRALVLGTDVFDEFVAGGGLADLALGAAGDDEVRRRVLAAPVPEALRRDLGAFLAVVGEPLAVRSSSLLEDSQFQPFAGVYDTRMIANDHPDPEVRLERLLRAVRLVYASSFTAKARAYLEATGYRLEQEKMAVVLQALVGARRGRRFYPDFAGVARSQNFYPAPPAGPGDGVAAVALGFGETVVDGEVCYRFCPRYPRHVIAFSSVEDVLRNSQRTFYALRTGEEDESFELHPFPLEAAERDGTLAATGSTYSPENDVVYDGIDRPGVRLVSFAGVLKHGLFPLAALLDDLLGLGADGIGGPVEMEFAVDLAPRAAGGEAEFAVLQLRPIARAGEAEELATGGIEPARVLCRSSSVLGHGRVEGLRDLVVVDRDRFDRGRSRDVAAEVARLNAVLLGRGERFVLVGVGRWGSSEPLLGIPVTWDQISGARVIVEAGLSDIRVVPSEGSHFFQNLTAASVGYFTVNPDVGDGFVDWEWLAAQPAAESGRFVRHLRLPAPLLVLMNGHEREGVIVRPRDGAAPV